MAQIGCLGDIVFTVSSRKIETIDNVQWAGSVRYTQHQIPYGNALTEFTGIDSDTISFDMVLSAYLGVDVMTELTKIWTYERQGRAVPFVVGNKVYGKYRWTIESHKIKFQTFDKWGELTGATVSVSLLEYLK